jgi:hypothetical protein
MAWTDAHLSLAGGRPGNTNTRVPYLNPAIEVQHVHSAGVMSAAQTRFEAVMILRLITSSYLVGAYRAGFDKAARSPSGSAATP